MEKAFKDDWFNKEYDLNMTKTDLQKPSFFNLKEICTNMVGVALGSPLGPFMANAVMCDVKEQLTNQNKIPAFYNRYVDETLSKMPDVLYASEFLFNTE